MLTVNVPSPAYSATRSYIHSILKTLRELDRVTFHSNPELFLFQLQQDYVGQYWDALSWTMNNYTLKLYFGHANAYFMKYFDERGQLSSVT